MESNAPLLVVSKIDRFTVSRLFCSILYTEPSLASQHEAAVNDAKQIWPPLIATCGHLSWTQLGYRSVTSYSSPVAIGRCHCRVSNICLQ